MLLSACLEVSRACGQPWFLPKNKIKTSVVTEATLLISRAQKMAAKSSAASLAGSLGNRPSSSGLSLFVFCGGAGTRVYDNVSLFLGSS